MVEKMNNKAQIAIWVVIAMVLVASILLYFFVNRTTITTTQVRFNPQQAIEQCAKDAVNEATDIMIPQGGFLEPNNYKLYNGTKIVYLCHTPEYFKTCINLHPMLLAEIKEQIKDYTKPKVEQCFDLMKEDAAKRNIVVELGEMKLDVSLALGRIFINITRETKITEKGATSTLKDYDFEIANSIYDLANVAKDIANGESSGCNFNYLSYMFIKQNIDIRKNTLSDYTRLYKIKDKASGKEMNIAIRSCAIPIGLVK
jgi:hypothetical protein